MGLAATSCHGHAPMFLFHYSLLLINRLGIKHLLPYHLPLAAIVLSIKTTSIPFVAGSHVLIDLEENDIAIAISPKLADMLKMSGAFAFKGKPAPASAI